MAQRDRLGEAGKITENLLSLAEVHLETGHPEEARQRADDALRGLSQDDNPNPPAAAQILLARAALALGKYEEARSFLQKAAEQAGRSEELVLRVRYRLAAAELAERSGDLKEAGRLIEEAGKEAKANDYPTLEIDSAVAAGALALRQGDQNPLAQARKDAMAVGYELAVSRADRLLAENQPRARVP